MQHGWKYGRIGNLHFSMSGRYQYQRFHESFQHHIKSLGNTSRGYKCINSNSLKKICYINNIFMWKSLKARCGNNLLKFSFENINMLQLTLGKVGCVINLSAHFLFQEIRANNYFSNVMVNTEPQPSELLNPWLTNNNYLGESYAMTRSLKYQKM